MIWFDIIKLEKKLIDGDLSEKESFNYLFTLLVITAIGRYMSSTSMVSEYENKWFILIEAIVLILILVVQLRATFNINNSGDGKDFIKRYICLAFVVNIRLFMYGIAIGLPLGIIIFLLADSLGGPQNIFDIVKLLTPIILGIFYYFMLTNSFKRVNKSN